MQEHESKADTLRRPLDEVLGSIACVRLLRLLAYDVDAPMSAADAADRVGLTAAGARRALERLLRTGFVVRLGGGRGALYQVRAGDPLVVALNEVFRAEADRYDSFLQRLRSLFEATPEVLSAWVSSLPAVPGAAIEIAVVATTDSVPWIGRELRTSLSGLESSADQVIELAIFSPADAPTPAIESVIPLSGTLPVQWPPAPRRDSASHAATDDRSLRMSAGIADLLRSDPSMAKRALRHVERLLREDQGAAGTDLMEWKQLLEAYSPERLGSFLVSSSSRAARLRQSSPFFAVLSFEERERLMDLLEASK